MNSKLFLIILSMLLMGGFHIFLGVQAGRELSPTYDEPVHLTAGAVYWKTGDYRYNGFFHPPLGEMWAAIPLIFKNILYPFHDQIWIEQSWQPVKQYAFADRFLFHNRIPCEDMMSAGRAMQLILSVLFGLLLAWAGWRLGGGLASLLAVSFWASSPTFLAQSGIVSTDLAFAFFFFAFFCTTSFLRGYCQIIFAGVSMGLCVASKYFSISLGPIMFCLLGWEWLKNKREKLQKNQNLGIPRLILIAALALLTLAMVYRFTGLEIFWEGLVHILSRSQEGRSSFLWGQHRTQGWFTYFPLVFLIKTPIPLMISSVVALLMVMGKKLSFSGWFWIPPLLFFLISCFSKVQIGHRHILAVYPFLILFAAFGLSTLPGGWKWISLLLLGWSLYGTWQVRPHFLAYFNEGVGGAASGYKYLTDSNVDWGQGLKMLAAALNEEDKKKGIYLSYFGTADPHYYGINYLNVGGDNITGHNDDGGRLDGKLTKLAISVTNFQSTYYAKKDVFKWLEAYTPEKFIAYSIFLYDFSHHPEALEKLEKLRGGA